MARCPRDSRQDAGATGMSSLELLLESSELLFELPLRLGTLACIQKLLAGERKFSGTRTIVRACRHGMEVRRPQTRSREKTMLQAHSRHALQVLVAEEVVGLNRPQILARHVGARYALVIGG